jgi:hypothetical protein
MLSQFLSTFFCLIKSKNLDQDKMRKKRLEEIFMKSEKTQDDAIFIEHYLKHYFTPTAVNEIRGFLEQNHFFNVNKFFSLKRKIKEVKIKI